MTPPRVIVLISGTGSNLQALINGQARGNHLELPTVQHHNEEGKEEWEYQIVLVVSNRPNVYGLERAKKHGIPTICYPLKQHLKESTTNSRQTYDVKLAELTSEYRPDLVVLAGFMHILSAAFLDAFPCVINLHPALKGEYDGLHAMERAFQDYQEGKIERTGVMVHRVIPEVDRGEVVISEQVNFIPKEEEDSFKERMHQVEHRLIVKAVLMLLSRTPQTDSFKVL